MKIKQRSMDNLNRKRKELTWVYNNPTQATILDEILKMNEVNIDE